ncbi:SLC13 family permease [Pasteurella multocida]|uniref:SLC13 family permease n=2 Tax=Pasteurella multocida TaxID=747 RepID=UPI000C19F9B6|nr:SLC13 family permease [Pasteurella multocida]NNI01916.1 SLC13 family permease [Pasteurella multocida]NNI27707.1 SLC13 family permease [Pasteurella multocida]NNI29976.1 SLC13 family permease [Pasteurella multocida]NNI42736.1 SLC13 family permease [Pasteurella multocida]NNI47259.1 SLC13 family permease [Pasteurella multocida]
MVKSRRFLFFCVSILFALLMTILLSDASFTKVQNYVLFLLFFAISLWVTEAIPPFSVSILIVGFLVFVMGKSEAYDAIQYLQTWSDSVIWLFLGGFFLAEAMKKTKLDLLLLKAVLPKFGNNPVYVLWGLMLVTAIMSMLMSNTATTAMMIATISPLFTRLNESSNLSKALLLGIPAAASVGGMGTIIGSAPNAISVGALEKLGHPISFLEWMMVGTPLALILLFIFWRVLVKKYEINKTESLDFSFLQETPAIHSNRVEFLHKIIVLVILAVTLFCWLMSKWIGIPVAAASGIPIVGLTITGVLSEKDIRQLPWDTLMLVAGGLALGLAIEEQRIAAHFVEQISHIQVSFIMLLSLFGFITVILSNFMSNTAATTILIPMGVSLLAMVGGNDIHPMILPLVIGLSASCALFLPVSTPPNAIAFSTGLIKQSEFRLGGVIIGFLGPILSMLWILAISPLL